MRFVKPGKKTMYSVCTLIHLRVSRRGRQRWYPGLYEWKQGRFVDRGLGPWVLYYLFGNDST